MISRLFDHHLALGDDGSIDVRALPAHGGVYLISDRDDRPILLAHGENLRRLVVNRLAAPAPDQRSKRTHLAEIAGTVHWRETFSRFETALEYWRIVRIHDPRGYRKTVGFGPAWFVRGNLEDRLPRFTVASELRDETARFAGPFPVRRAADEWVHMLEDVFDLCRYHDVLEQTPDGQPCAYFEMGRCPAPCDGSIPLSKYRTMIDDAWAFTVGDREPALARLRSAMQSASTAMRYEKAASIRQTIRRSESMMKDPDCSEVANVATGRWLVIQRGGPRRRKSASTLIKPFYIHAGAIKTGEPITLRDIPSAAPDWIETCRSFAASTEIDRDERIMRSELLWLLSRFLFQGDRAPGLIFREDRVSGDDMLVNAIKARFEPPPDDGDGTDRDATD